LATGSCVVGLFTVMSSVAQASIAFTPPALNSFGNEPTGNDGEFFTPTTSIWVSALGYVSPGSSVGNEVGIYNVSTTTLLASATLTSSSTVDGNFLYEAIAPVLLTAGQEYAVVGLYTAGNGAVGYTADSGVGAAAGITFNGYAYDNNSTLDLPTDSYMPPIFGPNFQFTAVPEASTMIAGVLLLLPFGACGLRILRKSRMV
jgi:hypothetical protein